jgi:hypothetical protein
MFHPVEWDVSTNRPIINEKLTDAETGKLQEPVGDRKIGPPSVDFIWHNMNGAANFRTSRGPKHTTIDKLFAKVAKQVEDGLYTLISVNVTAYTFVVICASDVSSEEFHTAWRQE